MIHLLTQCQLFKGMHDADKEECMRLFKYQIKKYQKGDIIVYAQDEVTQQLLLLGGSVKNEMNDYSGKTIKIADLDAPKILAPAFLFANQNRYPITIIAKTNCEIMAINKAEFLEATRKSEQLQLNFMNIISNQTQFLTRKISFLTFKTIKGKIAHFLLSMHARQQKTELMLPQTQTQLADFFGVARPSLSRAFGQLNNEGIIKLEGKHVTLLDIEALKACLD